ncbi:MAG: hypothetical protein KatS3mg117_0911 [Geminicoccaceae bacterium]|jgi:hypothetical protein|nr:MAG: hypothetical protein KatS3mg117_0911 [Geminicoccaceae bacterium]
MTDHSAPKSASTAAPDQVTVLPAAHRRLVDAMLRCNDIATRTLRDCVERQAAVAGTVLRDLWSAAPPTARTVTGGDWPRAGERMVALVQELGTQLADIQRLLFEAQFAMLREVTDALVGEPAAAERAADRAAEATVPSEGDVAPVEAAPAEPPATTAELEPANGEAAKPRRGRRTAAAG